MVRALQTALVCLASQVAAILAANETPTRAIPSHRPVQMPTYPGPSPSVAAGPHPYFAWPPTGSFQNPTCKTVQYDFPPGTNSDPTRANAVREFYVTVWNQYSQHCFGHDDINIISKTCVDDLFGWGATIVDGLDTAIVMNLTDIVNKQLAHIAQTDFTYVDQHIFSLSAKNYKYHGSLIRCLVPLIVWLMDLMP